MVGDQALLARPDRATVTGVDPKGRPLTVDGTGLLGPITWWPYVDWTPEWPLGVPPQGRDGHSTMIALQYVYALDRAAARLAHAQARADDRLLEVHATVPEGALGLAGVPPG